MKPQQEPQHPLTQVDLLPPETLQRRRIRRFTAGVMVLGVFILAAIGAVYLIQGARLSGVQDDLAAQETTNEQLQGEIAALQDVGALQTRYEDTRELVGSLVADRVFWSGVLRDISLVIPAEAWLSGVSATVDPGGAGITTAGTTTATTEVAPGLVGQITFSGYAMGHRDVALWLSRLEHVRGFANPWLSTSQKTLIGTTSVVQFTSSVDLTEQALASHGKGAQA